MWQFIYVLIQVRIAGRQASLRLDTAAAAPPGVQGQRLSQTNELDMGARRPRLHDHPHSVHVCRSCRIRRRIF